MATFGAALAWWVAPTPSLLWRLPLLVAIAALSLVYAFRGLVRMAFIFDASPFVTFLLAPLLLPLAALPAICFVYAFRWLPRRWHTTGISSGRRALEAAGTVPVAWALAAFIDLVETVLILRAGIRLPRLPFDPF